MFFNEKLGIHTYVYIYIIHYTLYIILLIYVIFCNANLTMPFTFSSTSGAIIDSWYARLVGENDAKEASNSNSLFKVSFNVAIMAHVMPLLDFVE